MWHRFAAWLRCPACAGRLELRQFQSHLVELSPEHVARATSLGLMDATFNLALNEGVLLCPVCRVWHPITRGVPVLLGYRTSLHAAFARSAAKQVAELLGYSPPDGRVPPGEELVMRSFSTEWLDYTFDGVIWEMDYSDHEQRFLRELGPEAARVQGPFLELGCGIGITTHLAQKNFGVEAVGVDLSLAAMSAARHFSGNPFLHFVQASVFNLPFAPSSFGTIYSRGVLHHTYSTKVAFQSLSGQCRARGFLYLWVYGPGSIKETPLRRILYSAEVFMRWILNAVPGCVADVALAPWAVSYILFNRVRHARNPRIQTYNYRRALHAARDRFTPKFAHRHDSHEVSGWFRDAGFEDIHVVDWRTMPSADFDDYRRNTGVRGIRRAASTR